MPTPMELEAVPISGCTREHIDTVKKRIESQPHLPGDDRWRAGPYARAAVVARRDALKAGITGR